MVHRLQWESKSRRRFSKRRLQMVAAAIVLLGGAGYGLWQLSRAPCFQLAGPIVCRVDTDERIVALTFDDGPTPMGVAFLLPLLAKEEVRATFFLIGRELEASPELGRRLIEAGHEVGNHSYTHQRMVLVSKAFVRDELERTDALLQTAGATGTIVFRPPFLKKLLALPQVLEETGRVTVTADVMPEGEGRTRPDAATIVSRVKAAVRPGSIVLLHPMYPSGAASREAAAGVIQALKADGYRFVTVSELLAAGRGQRTND